MQPGRKAWSVARGSPSLNLQPWKAQFDITMEPAILSFKDTLNEDQFLGRRFMLTERTGVYLSWVASTGA